MATVCQSHYAKNSEILFQSAIETSRDSWVVRLDDLEEQRILKFAALSLKGTLTVRITNNEQIITQCYIQQWTISGPW